MPASCSQCQTSPLDDGFIEDNGQGARGYARWIPGLLERGIFGGPKKMGRPRFAISALRCPTCGHLELFAVEPD